MQKPTQSVAIVIGAYRFADFVRLCIRGARSVFGSDTEILVSDDHSFNTGAIEAVADGEGCSFITSGRRRSHCSGDWQTFINGAHWARGGEADVVLKISQRFIPLKSGFKSSILSPFSDPNVDIVHPSKMHRRHLARPGIGVYSHFEVLTDCFAWRNGSVDPEMLKEVYTRRAHNTEIQYTATVPEFCWEQIISTHFKGKAVGVDALSNPPIGPDKDYLRKASATHGEYLRAAEELGVEGDFDLREWKDIEGKQYLCRPIVH
jgi:hypothetical protein